MQFKRCELKIPIIISGILILGILITELSSFYRSSSNKQDQLNTISIKPTNTDFTHLDDPENHLYVVLLYYEIQYPEIVYTQAILETGYFTSRICKEYNNLFGLYNSATQDYYRFNHWSESVVAYKNYIQYKYKGGCYYEFLENIGYAEDPNYIKKLKRIVNKYDKRRASDTDFINNKTKQ